MIYMKYAMVFVVMLTCTNVVFCECPDWSLVDEVKASTLGDSKCVEDCNGDVEMSRTITVYNGGKQRNVEELYCIRSFMGGEETSTPLEDYSNQL